MRPTLCALALVLAPIPALAQQDGSAIRSDLASQEPPPALREDASLERGFGPDWVVIDAVLQIVNTDMITVSQVLAELDRKLKDVRISTLEERLEAERTVQRFMTERTLWAQAGDDMGVDPERVESSIDYLLETKKDTEGLESMSELLQDYGFDRRTERDFVRSELNVGLWRDAVLGKQPGALGRVTRDTYLRPGKLLGIYRENPELFQESARVRIQVLILHAGAWGGFEAAKKGAGNLRRQILDGADFGDLVAEYGARFQDSRGISETLEVDRLREEGWRTFAAGAEVGEVSEVLDYAEAGQPIGYQIIKLLEREEAPPLPPFTDGETQRELTVKVRRSLDDQILGRANQELYQSSWIWPAVER